MTSSKPNNLASSQDHSVAWITQVWLSFVISITATTMGIFYAPVRPWVRAYLGMGLMFSVGSSLSLAKTTRDLHESKKCCLELTKQS
ncbi:YiaA/YiaB family inner membrane protein [Alkalinema pantanalense CENA528]|uniref:YiaA/YiaB family inner membrane protein n=1 Tax=Alkalinema pantanalense TaxID=1620705 RepID=UPI003D6DCF7D